MSILIPGLYGLDAATAWRTFTKDPQKYLDRVAKDKSVQKEVTYFAQKAPKFENVDALVKDRRALQYLLDAYGLGSEINNAGRIKRILTEDPNSSSALVNKLSDPRFKAMAASLRLDQSMSKLQRFSFRETIKEAYVQNEFEQSLGAQDPALRQAAYFARNSDGIKDVYSVLGDRILRDVVSQVYNLPAQIAVQPVETQAAAILRRVDVKKFAEGINTSGVSQAALTNAKNDYSQIEKNLSISDAAKTQTKIVQDQLTQLVADYGAYTALTDTNGANAATITIQQTAIPQAVGFEQELRAGNKAIDSVSAKLQSLLDLVAQASDSNNSLSSLKTQFADLVTSINTSITDTVVTLPDGTTENILLNGSNNSVTLALNNSGSAITVNRFDATDLQTIVANAKTAFDAIIDSNDSDNIILAQSRILNSVDRSNVINTTIETDLTNLQSTVGSTVFAASLQTTNVIKGKQSVDDGLSRIAQIETLLGKIGDLAQTSQERLSTDDRSDLEASFLDYKTQIRDLITTTSSAGLDNLLNNSPDVSYEFLTGQNVRARGGYDFLTTISDVLDVGSLSNAADAALLETAAIVVTSGTDGLKAKLQSDKVIIDRVAQTYDPRAKLDLQLYDLQNRIDSIVTGAEKEGKNLLAVDQADINFISSSTGTTLNFKAQSSFASTVKLGLADAIAQLGNGITAISTAVNSLSNTVDRVKFNLDMDNRRATLELGRLGSTIDVLEPDDTASKSDYKTNSFTEKFIVRYLIGAGGQTAVSGGNSYLINLFGGGSGNAIGTITSLSVQV